jgi:hypothetical protein
MWSLILSSAPGQEQQQRPLVERLLKPDMTLQNDAQNKAFVTRSQDFDRRAQVRPFYVGKFSGTKEYNNQREFSASEFAAHHFRDGELASTMQARAERVKTFSVDNATGSSLVRDMPGASKKVVPSAFAGTRPFLVRGKSQTALSQRDTPLTIEQVRELLNKNK